MTLAELRASAEPVDGVLRFPPPYRQMAVTLEEAEWLYALVRLLKPLSVHEFGAGYGISAKFILEALKDNNRGELYSVEPDAALRDEARRMLVETGGRAMIVGPDEPRVGAPPDLVFIDSDYRRRPADIAYWLGGAYTGIVCVHDAARGYAELELGRGVLLPCLDGMWVGRAGAA